MSQTVATGFFDRLLKREWLLAVCLLAIGVLIRLIGLQQESAWIDEAYSISLAKHAIADIIRGTAADQHPPVYYILLHFWFIFSDSIYHARLLSVMLGIINIYQVWAFGRRLGGPWLGLGAGILLTISPMHVWYSQEARQYMLLSVLTTASMVEYWACLQGKRRWITLSLFTLLALYTHYFAVFALLAQVVYLVYFMIRERKGGVLCGWLAALCGVGLLFLPWLPIAINQFRFHTMPWISDPDVTEIRDIPIRLIFGSGVLALPSWLSWIIIVGLLVLYLWALWQVKKFRASSLPDYGLVSAWALLPYLVISGVSIYYPIFQFKQFLFLLPAFMILATAIAGLFSQRWKYLAYLSLLIIPIITLVYQQATLSKDDWRGLSAYIMANFEDGDVIYTNPAGSSLAMKLYLDDSISIRGYPPEYSVISGGWKGQPISADIAQKELSIISAQDKRMWLVEFGPEFWDPGGLIPFWLESNADLLSEQWFGRIHLYMFEF